MRQKGNGKTFPLEARSPYSDDFSIRLSHSYPAHSTRPATSLAPFLFRLPRQPRSGLRPSNLSRLCVGQLCLKSPSYSHRAYSPVEKALTLPLMRFFWHRPKARCAIDFVAHVVTRSHSCFAEREPVVRSTEAPRWSVGHDQRLLNCAPARHQVNYQNNRCYNQQEMDHPATNVSQESE